MRVAGPYDRSRRDYSRLDGGVPIAAKLLLRRRGSTINKGCSAGGIGSDPTANLRASGCSALIPRLYRRLLDSEALMLLGILRGRVWLRALPTQGPSACSASTVPTQMREITLLLPPLLAQVQDCRPASWARNAVRQISMAY
jgi:hypothetical protein